MTRRAGPYTLILVVSAVACSSRQEDVPLNSIEWSPIESLNEKLPDAVRVFAGRSTSPPIRAWYVRIDQNAPGISTRIVMSDDPSDNRETVSSFAGDLGACVVLNGGYFVMDDQPARHVGLLVTNGQVRSRATGYVTRDSVRYEVARAAIGFDAGGAVDVTWASSRGDTVFSWEEPPDHRPGTPDEPLDYTGAKVWEIHEAVAAGPSLVDDGAIRVGTTAEVFFGSSIPEIHPRTAAGRTAEGDLLLMVVDGRQSDSRGVDLNELAELMRGVGAVEALNLDGGGSSTLVVNGQLLNRPAGSTLQRQVMSALATFCDN